MKEQGQKCRFMDLNREIKQQVELITCSNKLRRYSFQNSDKSLSELLTIVKSFEDMKIYVDKVEKPDLHPANALRWTPRRSGKTCFQCGGVYPHKVKFQAESTVCNKCKMIDYYVQCCKTKLTKKVMTTRTTADKICILEKH